jgi:hypothetical protein
MSKLTPPNKMSLAELETEIASIEGSLAEPLARLAELKRSRRARLAGKKSGESRRENIPASAVRARRQEILGDRGHIQVLEREFARPSRTIHRWLGRRRPQDE